MSLEFDVKSYLEQGFDVVKANLAASVVLGLVCLLPIVQFAAPLLIVNFMAGAKAAQRDGKPIEIGALFDVEGAADKWVSLAAVGLGLSLCLVPGAMILFAPCVVADRSGTPFVNAVKGALAFGKANLIPVCKLTLALGVVILLAGLLCFVPLLLALPTTCAAAYLAYDDNKAAFEAAAAEGGVQL